MSIKRRDLVRYLEENRFQLLREGANHSIYTNGIKTIPVKRHRVLDRITAKKFANKPGLNQSFETPANCSETVQEFVHVVQECPLGPHRHTKRNF